MSKEKKDKPFADVPLGFGMALSKNVDAMEAFAKLSETERQSVINKARSVQSKQEMQQFVNSLTSNQHNTGRTTPNTPNEHNVTENTPNQFK